jgi:excisionase family DNA binding protein
MNNQEKRSFIKPTMSAVELAKQLGVGKNSIYAAVKAGQIPNIGIGKTIRIPTSWFLNLLDGWKKENATEE